MAISGSFTATGVSSGVRVDTAYVWATTSFTDGSGVGTVKVQVSRDSTNGTDGTWVDVDSITADDHRAFEGAGIDSHVRLNCTAYTSGTIAYWIGR